MRLETSTAMILAAGCGSRLNPDEGHKLVAQVAGRPMIDWHLKHLATLGVKKLVIVTGYENEQLKETLRPWIHNQQGIEITYNHNSQWEKSNGLSVLCGAEISTKPFWLLMSDHLFSTPFIARVKELSETLGSSTGAALFVDSAKENIFDVPDVNKLIFDKGKLCQIGKNIAQTLDEFDVSDTGIFWCNEPFVHSLRRIAEEKGDCSTSDAVIDLVSKQLCDFPDVTGALWQDIDTPEALEHVERLIEKGSFVL